LRPDHELDALTDHLTSRFRDAFNARDIDTLRTLYEPTATSVVEPGRATHGEERARTLDHFFEYDTCESVVRHAYVADDVALLVVDWSMSRTGPDGRPERIEGAATDVVRRGSDRQWRYLIDNPFGSGTS
jgi:ketosteroid isomerase-like protein